MNARPSAYKLRRFRRLRARLLLLALLLALLVPAADYGVRAYAERQIVGGLRFDPAGLPDRRAELGAFVVRWEKEPGRVVVTHQDEPERELWASLPGTSFVAAGQGEETVLDDKGAFFITDRLRAACADQAIEEVVADTSAFSVTGRLGCGGEEVGYTLRFTPAGPHQLGFALSLDDARFNRTYLTYAAHPDEHFFGFGEQFSRFDMKGQRLPIFSMEQGIGRGDQPITLGANLQAKAGGDWHTTYAGVPHYISSAVRSLYLETYEYAVFDMRRPERTHIQLFGSRMAGRILHGRTPAELIGEYTASTGRMRRLPDWMMSGAVIGMQGGTEKVRQVLAELDARDTPIAAFWLQDWVGQRATSFGSQLWWNWELDETRYPSWDALRAELAARDIRVLLYINPFLTDAAENSAHQRNLLAEARDAGFLVRDGAGEPYAIPQTSFSASLVDLSNPAARAWLADVMREQMLGIGASGWMADFGEGLPYDAWLFSGEPASAMHNRWPELWAELNREVADTAGDDAVFFMRAAYRGSPAASTLFWEGDQLVSWDEHDGIKSAVTGLLSGGMSGFSLNHSDIGGYTTISNPLRNYHRSKELLLRWTEMNAFTAIFRTHEGNRPAENVQFYSDADTLDHFGRFAKVYAAWEFYRRQLVDEASATGLPVVRHPFIHYPDDPAIYGLSHQEFMVGSELLVAPVLDEGATAATVYLPRGRWVHLWSGALYGDPTTGTRVTVGAPIGQPAVFFRDGSAVGAQLVDNLRAAGLMGE